MLKKQEIVFLIIIFLCSSGFTQFWRMDDTFENNTVIVSGSVELEVPADYASFKFTVKAYGNDLRAAVDEARKKVGVISKALFSIGLKETNLTTSRFYSGENTKNKAFLSSKRDYTAAIDVIVKIDDFNFLEAAVVKVAEYEPAEMSDISYGLKNYEDYRRRSLKAALDKAAEKADLIARELKVEIDHPIYVEETPSVGATNYTNSVSIVEAEISGISSIFTEKIKLEKSVKVIYQIKSAN